MAIMGHQVGQELCEALGLPKNTVGFTLRCYAGEFTKVECEYLPEDGSGLATALAEYFLVERKQPKQAAPVHFDAWMRERKESAHQAFMAESRKFVRLDSQLAWDKATAGMTDAEITHAFLMGRIGSRPQ